MFARLCTFFGCEFRKILTSSWLLLPAIGLNTPLQEAITNCRSKGCENRTEKCTKSRFAPNHDKYCPCHSGNPYGECCEPYHRGRPAENALVLMRSRYAAYALHLADYIIATTHRNHPSYSSNTSKWKRDILSFSSTTRFLGLTIRAFSDGEEEAYVTFTAHLEQNGKDASFTEKSRFVKEGGRWLYESGERL